MNFDMEADILKIPLIDLAKYEMSSTIHCPKHHRWACKANKNLGEYDTCVITDSLMYLPYTLKN